MDQQALWKLIQDNLQSLSPFYQEAMGGAIQDTGVPDHWFALSLARGCEPEPLTFQLFQTIFPYAKTDRLANSLKALVEADLFIVNYEDKFSFYSVNKKTLQKYLDLLQKF